MPPSPGVWVSDVGYPRLMNAVPGEEQDMAWADFYTTCLIVTNKYCERAKQWLELNPTVEGLHARFRFLTTMQRGANAYARDRRRYVRTKERDERRAVTRQFNYTARMIWVREGLDIDLFNVALELRNMVIVYNGDPDEENWEDIDDDDGIDDEPESKACNLTQGPQTGGTTKTTASDFREQQSINIPSASAYEQHTNHSATTNQRRQFLEISTQQQPTADSQDQQHNQATVQGPQASFSRQQHQPSSVTTLQYPLKTQGPIAQQAQAQKTQAPITQQQYQKGQATVTQQPQFPVTEQQHQRNQTIETQPLPQRTPTLTRGPYKQGQLTTTQQIPEISFTVQHQDLPAMCERPEKAQPTVAQEGQQQPQIAPVIAAEQQSQKTQATITRELQPQKSQANVNQQQNQKGAAVRSQQSPRAQATMGPHSQKTQASDMPQQQPKGATAVTQTPQATGTVQQQPKTTGTFVTQNTKSVGIPQQQQKNGATHTTVTQQQQPKTSFTQQHPAKGAQQQQKDKRTAIPQLPLSAATIAQLPHIQPKESVLQQQKNLVVGTSRVSNSTTQQQGQYKPQQAATEKPQGAPGVTAQSQNPGTAAQQQQGARSPGVPAFQKPFDFKGLGISDEWLAIMEDGRDSEADAEYFRNMKGPSTQEDGKGEEAIENEEGIWNNADWGEWPEWWWETLSGEGKITKARYAEVLAKLGYSFDMDRCWAEFEEEEK